MPIILLLDEDFPVTAEHEVYWRALGRFIHRYAMLEQQIAYLLSLCAKVPKERAQALFSGVRVKDAMGMIEKLREVRGDPEDPDLTRLKKHLGDITDMRNNIVHYGATLHADGFHVKNTRTIPRLQTNTAVSAAQLEAMTDDMQTMAATLYVHQCIESQGKFDAADFVTDWREVGRSPWKYKPPPQGGGQNKRRDGPTR
jgi:hypothetical protein